jgi:hypothetical protein
MPWADPSFPRHPVDKHAVPKHWHRRQQTPHTKAVYTCEWSEGHQTLLNLDYSNNLPITDNAPWQWQEIVDHHMQSEILEYHMQSEPSEEKTSEKKRTVRFDARFDATPEAESQTEEVVPEVQTEEVVPEVQTEVQDSEDLPPTKAPPPIPTSSSSSSALGSFPPLPPSLSSSSADMDSVPKEPAATVTDYQEVIATDQTDQVITASTLDHPMEVSTEEPVLELEGTVQISVETDQQVASCVESTEETGAVPSDDALMQLADDVDIDLCMEEDQHEEFDNAPQRHWSTAWRPALRLLRSTVGSVPVRDATNTAVHCVRAVFSEVPSRAYWW